MSFELLIDICPPGTMDKTLDQLSEMHKLALASGNINAEAIWTTEFGEADQVISLWRLPNKTASHDRIETTHLCPPPSTDKHIRISRRLQLEFPFDNQFAGGHFYDFRTYTLYTGMRENFLKHMKKAMPVRTRHSRNVGVWTPVDGNTDQIIHVWAYRDLADRARARAGAWQEPEWRSYLDHIFPLIRQMQNALLMPVKFSPMQ
jgi:hypothetical protein